MAEKCYIGIDLGAESGRVMTGLWDGKRLRLEETHRFANGPVWVGETMRWDVLRLWAEVQHGLALAAKRHGGAIVSVGADTWGVDFVLLSKHDELLGQPWHYRDPRTRGMFAHAFSRVPRAEIFAQTGVQFMELNTLYQLLALQKGHPELLEWADCLLLMPDYLHWCLCGARVVEFTNGTTTQCLHPLTRDWARDLLRKFNLPSRLFPRVVAPGTRLGQLRESLAGRLGLRRVQVVAPPTHDTAAAVAGIPTANTGHPNWAYISSGTWSLMGVEVAAAQLGPRVLHLNLTNEGGIDGAYRLLKNIMGLWLVQQCKRSFEAHGRPHDYGELARLAADAPALRALVDPDDARFLNPPDIVEAIQSFCRETGQAVPQTEGELVRCAYESLALKYREVFGWLEELTGNRIEVIHIVGGGSQNQVLNQFTASACERPVIAGPVEATVMGNLLVQARASGEVGSLAELRQVVRDSSSLVTLEPGDSAAWREAAGRFAALRR